MHQTDLRAIGAALAARHNDEAEPDRELSLANYSERSRVGDWSMRAALTRYGLPHAVRAANVITLVRRLDAALHSSTRSLERHTVICDRGLAVETLADPPVDPYPDTRVADLARVEQLEPVDFSIVLEAYESASAEPLDDSERSALPLLGVALQLDRLADVLTGWADRGPKNPPVAEVDAACELVQARLDALGVPVEGPPPRGRGRRDRV